MLKKALIIILAVHFVSIVIQSCSLGDMFKVTWTGFCIEIIDTSDLNEYDMPVILEGNSINKNALGFRIDMESSTEEVKRKNYGSVSECKADDGYVMKHSICSITIKTIFDYSEDFPAGSDISSLFEVGRVLGGYYQYDEISTIDELLNAPKESASYCIFDLHLIDNTCTQGLQKFEIAIKLSDDVVFEQQTIDLMVE